MKNSRKFLATSALLGTAFWIYRNGQQQKSNARSWKKALFEQTHRSYGDRKAFLIGDGIESLAAAAFLIRDMNFPAENIHFYHDSQTPAPSDFGSPEDGFSLSSPYVFHSQYSDHFLELMSFLPSTLYENWTLKEELLRYGKAHPLLFDARLIDGQGKILPAEFLGLNPNDRASIYGIITTPEMLVEKRALNEWFGPHFFETNFWALWQSSFGVQKWSSLLAFKRRLHRMLDMVVHLDAPKQVLQTATPKTNAVLTPLRNFLKEQGAHFHHHVATNVTFTSIEPFSVSEILLDSDVKIPLKKGDICFITTSSFLDTVYYGDLVTPPDTSKTPLPPSNLWSILSNTPVPLGNPEAFLGNTAETCLTTFTMTMENDDFLKYLEKFSGTFTGNQGMMTFKDSRWSLSLSIPPQPYFKNQKNTTVLWGYGITPLVSGNYTEKSMWNASGLEILEELFSLLQLSDADKSRFQNQVINVIPANRPYATAVTLPGFTENLTDSLPADTENLAVLGTFSAVSTEVLGTDEHLVYGARKAVYALMGIEEALTPTTNQNAQWVYPALKAAYR